MGQADKQLGTSRKNDSHQRDKTRLRGYPLTDLEEQRKHDELRQ
jgi:hypothetical protein